MDRLSELDVLVVDCQTTGATPVLGAVLEVGWGIARANTTDIEQLQAHWVSLPAGHYVGSQVRRLTGFDEAEVAIALAPPDAWERLRTTMRFADRMPAAIHFAKFELAFLRDWSSRFEPQTSFPLDAVCVHAIACRLYPDLPRRSMRALAGYLGHSVDLARRCLGHVEATAHIWQKVVPELAARGIHTWPQLGDWLATPVTAPPRSKKRRYPLPSARYRTLPDAPGVYRLLRSNGDVLYVGKAASLRKRVGSHFTSVFSRTERALEMLTQVHDIHVTHTRTALEAALLENESIKELHPPYNVQLVAGDARTWFVDAHLVAIANEPSAAHRYGPLPSTFSVRAFGAIEKILSGESATRLLRARAMGMHERWAPGEDTFAEGLANFVDRYGLGARTGLEGSSHRRQALVTTARRLILMAKANPATIGGDAESEETDDAGAELRLWDAERVVRHLERGVMHGYQLLQRARWLCLLYDSAVIFREPLAQHSRLLLIQGGQLVEARDVAPDEPVPRMAAARPLCERQATFDRHQYDRLRIVTSELKRVVRDGGSGAVRVGRELWLRESKLDALLLWI
ncbi:MAG TPA: GIY-YIG nuclease family protein [Polyangiaceae bacterium]|nr:GIY-YIG nuclease family protein [Polyangiaceae bacterium]